MALDKATFGCGRFWITEAVFQHIRGVKFVQPGFTGGNAEYPSYEEVCSGETGHAEVVELQFDTSVVSYQSLLEVFFKIHDSCALPTAFSNFGSPHRSVIYYHNLGQKKQILDLMKDLERFASTPLTTEVLPAAVFYEAESEHFNFFKNHRNDPFCIEFIAPKIALSRDVFKKKLAA